MATPTVYLDRASAVLARATPRAKSLPPRVVGRRWDDGLLHGREHTRGPWDALRHGPRPGALGDSKRPVSSWAGAHGGREARVAKERVFRTRGCLALEFEPALASRVHVDVECKALVSHFGRAWAKAPDGAGYVPLAASKARPIRPPRTARRAGLSTHSCVRLARSAALASVGQLQIRAPDDRAVARVARISLGVARWISHGRVGGHACAGQEEQHAPRLFRRIWPLGDGW